MMILPNLPLVQERFYNAIKGELEKADVRYPEFECLGVFSQEWASTALGFGGVGGQAISSAYTTVFTENNTGMVGVFFGEKLAYTVPVMTEAFMKDLLRREMSDVRGKGKYIRRDDV